MKKTLLAFALAAAAPVLLAAGPKPPKKVTGNVRFTADGQQIGLSLNAQASDRRHAAKGTLVLQRPGDGGGAGHPRRTTIRVTEVTISGKVATICGQVSASDVAADRGRWVSVIAVDGGRPGRNGDLIGLTWAPTATLAHNAAAQPSRRASLQYNNQAPTAAPPPAGLTPVTAGNLQIR